MRLRRKNIAHLIFGFITAIRREFVRDQCLVRATGLAFASLLALVPLSTLLFSLFSALGTFEELVQSIQTFLFQLLVPTRQEEIMEYVRQFVDNTQTLGVVGLLTFFVTSMLLLAAIQSTFNAVWGTGRSPGALKRFATYASVLIVGSFLISIGLNLAGALRAVAATVVEEVGTSFTLLLNVFPAIFVFFALLLLLMIVPNSRVNVTSALLGAFVGALLWEGARAFFVVWTNYVLRLSVIYGSIAVIPLFLIWIYVGWAIVLLSLEITYVHQYRRYLIDVVEENPNSPANRVLLGTEVITEIARRFHDGDSAPTAEELARKYSVAVVTVAEFITAFQKADLIVTVGRDGRRYVPARSLDRITLQETIQTVFGTPAREAESDRQALKLFRNVVGTGISAVQNISLHEYIEGRIARPSRRARPPAAESGAQQKREPGARERRTIAKRRATDFVLEEADFHTAEGGNEHEAPWQGREYEERPSYGGRVFRNLGRKLTRLFQRIRGSDGKRRS